MSLDGVREHDAGLGRLLAGYRPLPGVFDEMMDRDGGLRAHWRPFLSRLAALGTEEINRRCAVADRHLRDFGVFYRVYEDPAGAERCLAAEPRAARHRARRMGAAQGRPGAARRPARSSAGRCLRAGEPGAPGPAAGEPDRRKPGIPAPARRRRAARRRASALLRRRSRRVRRPANGGCSATAPRRRPEPVTRWRTGSRSPRAMPDIYRALRVNRVAPFFQAFQAELAALNRQDDFRVCLLTPGPMNETYFEHAYLARYLGLLLVEGEDLTVREDGVFIRTDLRTKARRGPGAAPGRGFRRSAGAQRALAPRRARAGAGGARRQGGDRQLARRRRWSRAARCSPSCRHWRAPCSAPTSRFPTSPPGGSATPIIASGCSAASTTW